MANIDINAGLIVKADINKLLGDAMGSLAKFKENRKYDETTYNELRDKYAALVADIELIRNRLNDLIDQAQSNKLPSAEDFQTIDSFAGLLGAKNSDGSLDFAKFAQLQKMFGDNDFK